MSRALPLPAALLAALALLGALHAEPAAAAHVNVIQIDGSINAASADYILTSIAESERDGARAILIELDTPGGALSSTQEIIQAILNARVPVVVYVAPRGAWAASAGTFITLAGHVAAMAPSTSIGAASPVSGTGEGGERDKETKERDNVQFEKVEKFTMAFIESIAKERERNVEWALKAVRESEAIAQDKALELGVIDLVAEDRADLLAQIEGREVRVEGQPHKIEVAGAEIRTIEMTPLTRLFNFLANPDILVIVFMVGMLGIYIEFNNPGLIVPGVIGGLCLILVAMTSHILPFSWAGALVLLLGMGLIVAEIFVTSYGLLFAAGVACFLLGGTMLFDVPELGDLTVSFWTVLVPTVAGFAVFAGLVVFAVGRTMARAQTAGVSEMIGLVGRSDTDLNPEGRVFVRGEYWTARSDEPISAGDPIEVTAVEGMRLRVRRSVPLG